MAMWKIVPTLDRCVSSLECMIVQHVVLFCNCLITARPFLQPCRTHAALLHS